MSAAITVVLTFIFCATLLLAIVSLGYTLKLARVVMYLEGERGLSPENTVTRFDRFYKRVFDERSYNKKP